MGSEWIIGRMAAGCRVVEWIQSATHGRHLERGNESLDSGATELLSYMNFSSIFTFAYSVPYILGVVISPCS
jgi:hypothetical protein